MPTKITQPAVAATPVAADQEDVQAEDISVYELPEPLQCGQTTITKLFLDPSTLKGPQYFKLVARFRKEFPAEANEFFKLNSETFLALVISELNPPLTLEDFFRIPFLDLEFIFVRAKALAFQKGTKSKSA